MSGENGMPPLDLSIWRDACTHFGADPTFLGEDLIRDVVQAAIEEQPRSQQKEIGPSEIGVPCDRWLAHRFAGTRPTRIQKPPWRPAVGTAVHKEFTEWLLRYNERRGVVRFLADLRVYVGDLYPGRPIYGTLDGLDLFTATVLDLKVPGPTSMKKHGAGQPESPVYDVQFDLYGNGCINAGFPIASVGALRLPAAGELTDADWKPRPHNPERGKRALQRAGGIAGLVNTMGVEAIPFMKTSEHYCMHCPFFLPGAKDLTKACPGAESVIDRGLRPPAAIQQLIA